jgi:hypothetical protein
LSLPAHLSAVGLDADPVVDCVLKALLTTKVFLSRLNGDVAQQELDLIQLPSGIAAQAGAGPT